MEEKKRPEKNKGLGLKTIIGHSLFIIVFLGLMIFLDVKQTWVVPTLLLLIMALISLRVNQRLRQEIEERKQTAKALGYSEKLFRGIFNNASAGIALLDRKGQYQHANLTLCSMLGYTQEELKNMSHYDITFPNDIDISLRLWDEVWAEKKPSASMEKRYICKNGDILWVEANLSAIRGDDAGITDVIVVAIDITVRKRMEEELRHQATTDFLTGVDNRRAFMQKTQEEFSRAQRYQRKLALLIIDIDRFKDVNDLYGHLVGDRVLREVVKACSSALRQTDILARIGGEEFAVILIEADIETAKTAALRVQQKVQEVVVLVEGSEIQVTVSIGIGIKRKEDNSLEDIFKRADDALYRAKNSGRNKILIESEEL